MNRLTKLRIFFTLFLVSESFAFKLNLDSSKISAGTFSFWNEVDQDHPDSLKKIDLYYLRQGVITRDSCFFICDTIIDGMFLEKLFTAPELKKIMIFSTTVNDLTYSNSTLQKSLYFQNINFKGAIDFSRIIFLKELTIVDSKFLNKLNFSETIFEQSVIFENNDVDLINLTSAKFKKSALFSENFFYGDLSLESAEFCDMVDFNSCIFYENINLSYTIFYDGLQFQNSKFTNKLYFINTQVNKELNLAYCKFPNGLNLQSILIDSLNKIYLDYIQIPNGQFDIHWNHFKGPQNIKIQLFENPSNDSLKCEKYKSICKIIKNNFIAQNESKTADEVMYDYYQKEREVKKGFFRYIYWLTFGYGYKPYRFFLTIFCFILIFTFFWYFYYYQSIYKILFKINNTEIRFINRFLFIFPIYKICNSKTIIYPFQSFLHTFYFSTTIFLNIKIQKDWFLTDKKIIRYIMFEWMIGILFYLIFIYYVQDSQFQFLKGLFGIERQ